MARDSTQQSLDALLDRLVEEYSDKLGGLPRREHEVDWPSACEIGKPDEHGAITWVPVERAPPASFKGVENALGVTIHPAIKAYYGSGWCATFEGCALEGNLTLIQIWNEEEFDILCENILGHALAKRHAKLPLTVFFACTDEGELMLSVDNDSGEVVLEYPGEAPIRVIESSLASFLGRVRPVATR